MTDVWATRPVFEADHEAFRATVRTFLQRHVVDHLEQWELDRMVPREPWLEAGRQGLLGMAVPEDLGGAGVGDFRYRYVAIEEFAKVGATSAGNGFATHTDIVLPYFLELCTPEQAKRWIPGMVDGTLVGAVAMTEPGTGSDLMGMTSTARRDGDDWVLSGSKTFISNGIQSDVVAVAARTGARALSLFVVERGMKGFERGRQLRKIGLHGQDTAELSFDDVRLPADHLLGEEGKGMQHLMERLPQERMSIATSGVSAARAALAWTVDYVTQRKAFGKSIAEFQNTQFVLADALMDVEVATAYVDAAVHRLNDRTLSVVDAAKAKHIGSETHKSVADRCLQLYGGYGYMEEYPISRSFADSRVTTIYGGTSEIMKLIVARDLLGTR